MIFSHLDTTEQMLAERTAHANEPSEAVAWILKQLYATDTGSLGAASLLYGELRKEPKHLGFLKGRNQAYSIFAYWRDGGDFDLLHVSTRTDQPTRTKH